MDFSQALVRFLDRRRVAVLVLCALAAAWGAVGTIHLYSDLRTDVGQMLPDSTRSARDLEQVTARVGGYAQQTVVLHGADRTTLEVFADDLADALRAEKGLVRWVEYRQDEVRDFFLPRLLLFPSLQELEGLRDVLRDRIDWERVRAAGRTPPGPAPDVAARLDAIAGGRADVLGRFPDGYYVGEAPGRGPGERITILPMIVRMDGTPDDYAKEVALDRAVKAAVARLDPAKYDARLQVSYAGHVTSNILEHDALAEDLVWATLLVVVAVAAAVALYNRTWKAVIAVGVPLAVGTLVTFGIANVLVGHLNTNTAFLGSIVVGNGINVGLVFFARYLEERRSGVGPIPAMETAVRETWLGTLTAALAAGVAYASLMATDFRGFSQFGLIGGVGMALAWLTSYVVTPPLVLAWERRAPIPRPGQRRVRPIFTKAVSWAIERAPRATALGAAALTAASLLLVARASREPGRWFEYDFSRLRDGTALREGGPAWWDERVDALFGDHLTPTVILARDEGNARAIARTLEAHRKARPGGLVGKVLSVATVVPEGQEEKLPVVREIRALATPEHLAFLSPDRRMAVARALPPPDLRPFGSADLPEQLRRQITEKDGRIGTPVLVHPAGRMDMWDGRDMVAFQEELRAIPLPAGTPMASWVLLLADVLTLIARDGPRATALALAGVVLIVLAAFRPGRRARSFRDAAWVLLALAVGVVWFLGLAAALGLRLNMLSFIVLPITFGIGVDYATNIFQRRRFQREAGIAEAVRTTGGAVTLCSLTTIIGYSSLLVARNQALLSFGVLADLGEAACLAAALFALPAFLRWRELGHAAGPAVLPAAVPEPVSAPDRGPATRL
jgi:predicted RND superfamily exporter protein